MSSWRVFFATAWSIGRGWDGELRLKATTWDLRRFLSVLYYSNALVNTITNLSTSIPSYLLSTSRSVFSRRTYRLQFHAFFAVPALLTASNYPS